MRLAIVGKTRSGKSTALHRFLSHALRHPWAGVLLLDGKGCELHHYANLPGVTYYGMDEIDRWDAALTAHMARMAARYRDLVSRGLREAAPEGRCGRRFGDSRAAKVSESAGGDQADDEPLDACLSQCPRRGI